MKYIPFTFQGYKWVPSMEGIKVHTGEPMEGKDYPSMVAGWTCDAIPGAAITVAGVTVNDVPCSTAKCSLTHTFSGKAMPGRGTPRSMAELAATMVADLQADFTTSESKLITTLTSHKLFEMFMKRAKMGAFGRIVNTTPDAVVFTTGYLPAEGWLALIKSMKKGGSVRVERPDGRGVDLHGDWAVIQSGAAALLKLNPSAWCSLDVREYHVDHHWVQGAHPALIRAILDIIGDGVRVQAILWASAELAPLVMVPCEEQGESDEREAM